MSSLAPPSVPSRRLPGRSESVSEISFVLATGGPRALAGDPAIPSLRRAREAGVTTFRVADRSSLEGTGRLLRMAFPAPDPLLTVIVPCDRDALARISPAGRAASEPGGRVRAWVAQCRQVLPDGTRLIAVWHAEGAPSDLDRAVRAGLETLIDERTLLGVAYSVPLAFAEAGAIAGVARAGPGLLEGDLSPLDPELVSQLEPLAPRGDFALIATDPLAGGRLDGSRFSSSLSDRTPGAAPPSIRALQAEFDPVLRLARLTEGRRRTLAQASLRFVLSWPWVATAVVPWPSPERLDEILSTPRTPPLSAEEIERVRGSGRDRGDSGSV